MYSALTEIIDNPADIILFLIVSAVLFFASRLIIDGFNSGWSKRVINELNVLERMKGAGFDSDSKGKTAISSIENHINRIVVNNTTRRDRLGSFFEALQFFVIGAFSIIITLAWELFWGDIQPNSKDDVFLIVVLVLILLSLCMLVDIMRLIFIKRIVPKLKLLLYKVRDTWMRLLACKQAIRMKKQQKKTLAIWEIISEMTNKILDFEAYEIYPATMIQLSNRARAQLAIIREYKNTIRSSINVIDRVCMHAGYQPSNLHNRTKSHIWSIVITQLERIKGTYLVNLRYAEQDEERIREITTKYPASKNLLPESSMGENI